MDNLQRHYLIQLGAANQKALTGDIRGCLDTCFELRLKPDIALYTRAMVCLTICDLVSMDEVPEKLDFAFEAWRLAVELKAEDNPNKDSYWIAEYDRLVKEGEAAVEKAQSEQRRWVERLIDPQESQFMPGGASTGRSRSGEESDNEIEIQIEEDSGDDTEVTGMPYIEHLFTVDVPEHSNEEATLQDPEDNDHAECTSRGSSGGNTILELPFMPKNQGTSTSHLPAPLGTSEPGSEAPK